MILVKFLHVLTCINCSLSCIFFYLV
ncbi:hypothetical protein cypCar_00021131 [Cyprinus carpio]|nr:hypothetical protein cypCar_00021131 [Cyprinus carpio]